MSAPLEDGLKLIGIDFNFSNFVGSLGQKLDEQQYPFGQPFLELSGIPLLGIPANLFVRIFLM